MVFKKPIRKWPLRTFFLIQTKDASSSLIGRFSPPKYFYNNAIITSNEATIAKY